MNAAAWIPEPGKPLQVRPGPDQSQPKHDEVVIKVAAVALNPLEWKQQLYQLVPTAYPFIFGSDAAGTIVSIGDGVSRFKIGDRVIAHCASLVDGDIRHGAFQQYIACRQTGVAIIPDSLAFTQASVLPLSISSAACGLYEILNLRLPSAQSTPQDTALSEAVLIWGGATSVGSSAIQLAAAAGYFVITTASPSNHEYVKSLAPPTQIAVFDYHDPEVISKIVVEAKTLTGPVIKAFDCVGTEATARASASVLEAVGGSLLATALPPPNDLPSSIKAKLIIGSSPLTVPNHPGADVWRNFVPGALASGTLRALPEARVIGTGLDKIQEGLDILKKGVSATKLVVAL